MSYQRLSRKDRHRKWARARKERVNTIYGHLYNVLRFLGATRLAKALMRKPWHVADLYVDGRFVDALFMYPQHSSKDQVKQIMRLKDAMVKRAKSSRTHTKEQSRLA